MKTRIRETVSSYLYRRTKRSPMILPIILKCDGLPPVRGAGEGSTLKKRIWTVDLTILTLGAACAVLAGMLAAVKPMLLVVVVPVLAVMGLLLFWNVKPCASAWQSFCTAAAKRRSPPLQAWRCLW